MSFKPIETQEELDRIIQGRLEREREKFADYDDLKAKNEAYESQVATLQATIDESSNANKAHDATVAELNEKIKSFETANLRTKIALQHGIPIDLVDRLSGDDEESIKADAERFAAKKKKKTTVAPLKNTEPPLGDDKNSNWRQMASDLSGGE